MKALLIDPAPDVRSAKVIDVEPSREAWKRLIDSRCVYLGHLTLSVGKPSDLVAVFDDQGEQVGLPLFSVFSSAHGQRLPICGRTLVFASNDDSLVDVPDDALTRIDIVFGVD